MVFLPPSPFSFIFLFSFFKRTSMANGAAQSYPKPPKPTKPDWRKDPKHLARMARLNRIEKETSAKYIVTHPGKSLKRAAKAQGRAIALAGKGLGKAGKGIGRAGKKLAGKGLRKFHRLRRKLF
jgi:hypothetical protein